MIGLDDHCCSCRSKFRVCLCVWLDW